MSAQKARIYQRIENGEWRSTGKSTSTPEELVEGQTKSARGYKDQTSRTVSFVIAPLDKYPNELSSEELEGLLKNQPSALNGILE